tara:strand:+ start:82 stop:507 length:426 start_codon:yes stop_codon:yes gene_type:complete
MDSSVLRSLAPDPPLTSWSKVSDLKPESHSLNLLLLVHSVEVIVEKESKLTGRIRIGEIVVGDATGSVVISARNEQIDILSPGTTVIVRNGRIDMFDGYLRLRVDKWGSLNSYEDQYDVDLTPITVNLAKNISETKYIWCQ